MTVQLAVGAAARNDAGIAAALPILRQRFGDRCVDSETVRRQHGHQTTWLVNQPPDAVVFPESTEDVAEIVRTCAAHDVPVIAFGVGSSLEGHVNAPFGGVSIDMSRMNRVISVHPEDLDAVVEPGVTRKQLNDYLRDQGLFFPIDPGADASLGGMAATRASGTNAVRYGTMRDNVISLTAVMADGSVVRTGNRARKSSAGYDLARLLVGSEGTLGIITELVLRLYGIPEAIAGGVVPFDSVEGACNATILTIQSGIPVARIELARFADGAGLQRLFQARPAGGAAPLRRTARQPALGPGTGGGLRRDRDGVRRWRVCVGDEAEERNRLWQARHDAYWASFTLRPGSKANVTDACVPISRLAECVAATVADIARTGLIAPIVGHVGDGNFHLSILVDPDDPDEVARCEGLISRLNLRAIEMEGTCTGEHGIGQGKMKYLGIEHGAGLEVMRAIKQAIDPRGIMNPGKIVAPG